jgi:hypothetical protein
MPLEPLSTPLEILTMKWELKAAAVHASAGLKDRIDRRLRLALCRFESRVDHVVVFLQSLNGPKSAADVAEFYDNSPMIHTMIQRRNRCLPRRGANRAF